MKLGVGSAHLVKSDLTKAQLLPNESGENNAVEEVEAKKTPEIPQSFR